VIAVRLTGVMMLAREQRAFDGEMRGVERGVVRSMRNERNAE
jgi:hypothetical protein